MASYFVPRLSPMDCWPMTDFTQTSGLKIIVSAGADISEPDILVSLMSLAMSAPWTVSWLLQLSLISSSVGGSELTAQV